MRSRENCIATDALLLAASLLVASAAIAAPAGIVVRTTGPVFTQAADGRIKALSADSPVASGDTLVTGRETFAQLRFTDGGMATMGPDTRMAIGPGGPSRLIFQLGTLQVMGVPGSTQREIETQAGVIRAGSASFILQQVAGDPGQVAMAEPIRLASLSSTLSDALVVAQSSPPAPGSGLAAGLYVHVLDGIINLTNKGGSLGFQAGQFGYVPSINRPPVVVPSNPGLQFTPPPTFSSTSGTQGTSSSGKSNTVDCEVR